MNNIQEIKKPRKKYSHTKTDRIGMTKKANNGLMMTIIAYRNCHDIDVQFENGAIAYEKDFYQFKLGCIDDPSRPRKSSMIKKNEIKKAERLGMEIITKKGIKAKIIEYSSSSDITVQYEDGKIKEHMLYDAFKRQAKIE